jgi:hypothetical protein
MCTYSALREQKPEQANFQTDIACYWLDVVVTKIACLKCLSLVIRDYFDHSNMNPCVSKDSLIKNHVEIGEFPHGFCMILVRHGSFINGLSKICYLSYFLKIF